MNPADPIHEMKSVPVPPIAKALTINIGPGNTAKPSQYRPGDFILTHGGGFLPKLIRFGQCLRFRGKRRRFAWWSHTALIVSEDGAIIEADGDCVVQAHLSDYEPTEYTIVHVPDDKADARDRSQMVAFATSCLTQKYDHLAAISIGLSLLTGCKFSFYFEGQSMCSGLVSRALERTDLLPRTSPTHTLPADLAEMFGVEVPSLRTKGTPPPWPRPSVVAAKAARAANTTP